MKRFLWLILALALLTGCTDGQEDTPTTEPTQVIEPGIYTPGHTLETQSGGAVRVFPLTDHSDGIAFMGKSLLTFTQKDGKTVVTPYTGQNLTRHIGTELSGSILPGDKTLRILSLIHISEPTRP